MRGTEVPLDLMAHSVSRNGFLVIFSSCERRFLGFYIYVFLYLFLLRDRVFWVLFLCLEILLYVFPVLPLRGLGFLKESDLC